MSKPSLSFLFLKKVASQTRLILLGEILGISILKSSIKTLIVRGSKARSE
jgi:hypothetical protein